MTKRSRVRTPGPVYCKSSHADESVVPGIERLARELCGPLYEGDPALSTSVASAIASATSAAAAAVETRDPLVLESYPQCAVSVISLLGVQCPSLRRPSC